MFNTVLDLLKKFFKKKRTMVYVNVNDIDILSGFKKQIISITVDGTYTFIKGDKCNFKFYEAYFSKVNTKLRCSSEIIHIDLDILSSIHTIRLNHKIIWQRQYHCKRVTE